jgi:magnesium transporter
MPAISSRRGKCQSNPKSMLDLGVDRIMYMILDEMVDQYQPILDDLSDALDDLDDIAASDDPPRDLPRRISEKKRMLIYLRQLAGPQREVVGQMTRGDVHVIHESTRIYLRDVQDHLIRLYENVELYRDIVMGARDIYLSSISNHLNQIMKTLTIISVIGLPLTVITGFFGMNFDAIPGLHDKRGFWLTVLVMGVAVTVMLYIFKKKRWI